ncbi:MAG TPA: PAS domain S-box protein [Anaerolineales bacterium]|nr:PAS domain S-box protein [Anaerolineales bacterium]
MKQPTRILIVEDKAADADLAKHAIQKVLEDCEFQVVETRQDFLNALEVFQPEVILSDYSMPRFDGMKALNLTHKHAPLTPLIIWTGSIGEDVAVECMKAGANNYILKDNIKRLGPALIHALEERQLLLERRQVEEALQHSEKRFRALIENGLDNISLLKADGTLIWESPATSRMLNYAPGEFLGHDIFDLMHPDDKEWTRGLYIKLIQKPGSHERGTFRLRRSDGTWRWVDAIVTNMLNEPSVNAIVVNYRDITEQKRAEEALRESQAKYQNLVETSHDLIWSVDAEGKITFLNRAAKEIYGYEPEELIGHSFFDVMASEQDHRNSEIFIKTIAETGEFREVESQVRHRDGREFILSANSIVIHDNNGEVIGITGSSRDITERKRVENVLKEERNLLRTLVDNLPDRIYAMDIQGRKTLSNTADWRASGGKAMEDVIGKTDFDTYPPEMAEEYWQLDKAVLDSGRPVINHEEPGLDFDGKRVSILTTKMPLRDSEGKVIGLVGVGRDITERKQVEERLQLSDQILQRVSALVLVADPQGSIVYVSPASKTILGYEPEELLGNNWWQLSRSMPIDAQIEKEYVGGAAHGDVTISTEAYERPIQDRWGNIHWISWVDTAGPGDLLIGVGHDVTERREAEARMNDLLAFNEKILNHSPLGILTYTLTGECVFANENAALIVGSNVEILMTQNFRTIESWKKSGLYDLFEKAITTQAPVTADIHHSSTFGKEVWITADCVTFKSKDEDHILLSISDITERKKAEEALRESENRLILALSGAQMSVWEWNLQTNSILWSPEIFEITGIKEDDFGSTFESFTNLVHNEDVARVMASAERAVNEKSLFAEEFRIIRPDGEVRWISNLGHAEYDSINSYLRLIGTVQDVTPRKQAALERQALLEIMQGFAHTTDLQELLELIHYSIAKVIYARNFFVVLYDEEAQLFEEIYSVDQYDPPAPPTKLERSVTSYVFHAGEPLLLTQESFDQLVAQGEIELVGTNSASWLGVPLKTSGKTIGVIAVQDYERSNRYSEREKDFMASIATQVALAIERKQAEDALQKSEALYRQAMEVAGTVPYYESYYDDGGRSIKYEFIGDGIRQITGYGPEEFSAKIWDSLVEEVNLVEDLAGYSLDEGIRRVRTDENSTWKCEHRLRDREGKIHWVFEAAVELRDKNGVSYGSIGTYQDITKRKLAEEAEREQRALAEALRDTAETLSSTLEYGEVLDRILAAVGRVVPHDAATIMLIDGDSAHVVRSHGYNERGFHTEIMGVKLPLAETNNLREMLETGKTVVIHDTHSYISWKRLLVSDWLRSNVGAPISIYGQVIGFILLDSQKIGFFTPVHAERLEAFANQAAVAIHNARLLQQAQEEINERKRTEAELRASEERFRQLAENIEEAFWMTDAEGDTENYLSPAAEVIWERPIKSLVSDPNAFINSVFPEDQPAILQAIEKEKSGEKVEIEYRIIRPNGSVRWVWDRAFPIFDATGKVKKIAGITADITERRESEIALLKSQSRYHELFDSSPISIWEEDYSLVKEQIDLLIKSGVTDLREYFSIHPEEVTKLASLVRVTDINKASLELYQVEHKEDLLNSLTEAMGIEPLSHFENEIFGLMSPLKRFVWEGADKTINGRQIEVIVNGSIPEGYEEDWSKVIVSIIDITERRQAEQQLRKLSRAVEQSASTIVITDTVGNIEYVNPKFTEITGYTFEEALGHNPRILKSGLTSGEVYKQLWQTVVSGKEWHGELLNKKKNDELYWEYVTISPIFNERGQITNFVGVKEDITQRKQSEVETQRHLTELEALYENGLAVGRLLTANEIGDRMINTFAQYLEWHHVTIRLRKEESDDLELVAFSLPSLKEEERAKTEQNFALINKVGQGLSGWVIQSGLPLRTGNVHTHPRYMDTHVGIQSGLYMPLKVGEQVIGVVSVESELPDAFTEQDERLLVTLANQAAIAFENARLYETIQKELTERKRIERDLRASEVHYRQLADSITDILFELDQDLHYTHWNKASETLTGIPAKDAIGKSMHEIFGESADQIRISQIYESVLKNHQPKTFETIFLLNEQKRFFEINAYPSTRGLSVVAKDVTERKQSETIMQKRFELMEYSAHHSLEELMQKTTDEVSELTGSSIGFFHFVDEDHITLRMQTWSTNALQLFQVPISEGTHLPLDQAGIWAEAARQRRPLIQNDYESLSKKRGLPQGHVPITREMIIPIIRNERIMAIMGIGNKPREYRQSDLEIAERLADYAWDITERKQMEMALEAERNQLAQRVDERTADLSRANSNLARALRVKDEFLANMSHELRTPLNAILGLSESLGEQIAGPLNEKQQKYIATIGESGHHLLSLINDILDLAKIDAGQITLDINKVDIHSVCQASLRMIKQLAQKKNQEVSLEIDKGLGLMWADERRLKQMIVNLLGNAVKFTPENGTFGLEVHGDEEANKIDFTVWDKGIGIREEDLTRLFQPFVQLDSGLARETTGTGLGLALVAQMARLHGGSINVVSQPEGGSRFTIVLPWEPALAMDAAARMKVTGKFRAIKVDETNKPVILLVEDTKEVTMMIKDYLELTGYKVVTAQDGVDAIVQAKLVRPDLILMDVQMPRMDGLDATRKLRSEPGFRYTPIIALTALAMPSDRERCLEAGMDDYISKPVNLKALIKIIQNCLFSNQGTKS